MPESHSSSSLAGQLVFLGTGTSVGVPMIGCECTVCQSTDPRNSRTRCGVVLGLPEGTLLVDTPPELRLQLVREKIGLVHAVLYTHEHADHLYGLDDVRLFPLKLGKHLPLYCEAPVEARIRRAYDYCFSDLAAKLPAGGVPRVEFERITTEPFSLLGMRVIPIRLRHGRGDVLGFRFGNVAYCTDVSEIPADSWPLLAGLDVLILDALRPRPHPTHFSLEEAIAAAEKIAARRTIFTHMSHELDHAATCAALPASMELAYDGLRVPLA
ncbi:MAG: MBL fold metallo-hydrolase [Pirellulales bacterium]